MMPIPAAPYRALCLLALLALIGCTPLPDIALPAPGSTAQTPALLPMEEVLARAGTAPQGEATTARLEARAAALRARAATLRQGG